MNTSDDLSPGPRRATPPEHSSSYGSLEEALRDHKIPLENWNFIRRLTEGIGIDSYHGTTGYIKAVRREGEPAVNIAYGYSNGFRSAEELRRVVGNTAIIWPSGRVTKEWPEQWGVDHPVHGHGSGSDREAARQMRDFGTCPECHTKFSATGSCFCD